MLRAVMDPQTKRIVYRDDGQVGQNYSLGMPPASRALPQAPNARPGEIQLPELSVGPGDTAAPSSAPSMSMGGMAPPTIAGALGQGAAARMPVRADPTTPLGQHLASLEQNYGLPQGYLAQIRAIESSNGRNLQNPNSSAAGPYQIIDGTMKRLGLTPEDRMDEYKSAAAIAKMAGDDAKAFQSQFGRAPTGADIYGMHQQGRAGYFGLLNGQTPGQAAQALNGAGGMDAQGQLGVIQRMYQNARPDLPGDPTTRYGNGGGATLQNAPSSINAVSPLVTQGAAGGAMGGDSGGGTPAPQPAAAAPDPSKGTFNGGLYGLLQGDSYTGQGSGKDFSGKMGDFVGSDKFKAGMSGLATLLGGGGGGATVKAPGIQALPAEDQENKPNMSLLQMMYGRRGGMGAGR